jgi:endonuclease/exonuclease/phosphatase family metal-dependent hydrolase
MRYLLQLVSLLAIPLLAVPILAGCVQPADPEPETQQHVPSTVLAGRLQDKQLDEASGIARSQRHDDVFWLVNDSGKPRLFAIDGAGKKLGRVKINGAKHVDWEDIASFTLDGKPYLLIADIGDNEGKRRDVTLYVVEEPEAGQDEAELAWSFDFSYPKGPLDAESLTVDIDNERILILSKREIPAVLYELPLRPTTEGRKEAQPLLAVRSLPQPSRQDVMFAPATDKWFWQTTAMDISGDRRAAVILTYGGVYYYRRSADSTWVEAFQTRPAAISVGDFDKAESVAFSPDGKSVFVTFEGSSAILLRIDLNRFAEPEQSVSIMTINFQNLFDNLDDPEKDDKAYLPIEAKQTKAHVAACNEIPVESWRDECLNLDWSDAAVEHKLSVLADTIKQVDEGRGADIIAVQEVENVAILERLRTEYLADSAYLPAILVEGTDARGIDSAFLSRLPLVKPAILHPLVLDEFPERAGDTRGVLEATFELPDGSLLTGFAVHFPAPYHPTEMRVLAYEHLTALRDKLPPGHNVFAAGDFNTTSIEDEQKKLLAQYVRPVWAVSNDACAECPGTYYYARDKNWSFLDMILFSPASSEQESWQVRADSVQLANRNPAQVSENNTPNRYDSAARMGVSDHWPIVLTLEPRP